MVKKNYNNTWTQIARDKITPSILSKQSSELLPDASAAILFVCV